MNRTRILKTANREGRILTFLYMISHCIHVKLKTGIGSSSDAIYADYPYRSAFLAADEVYKATGCVRIDMWTDLGYLINRTLSSYPEQTLNSRMLSLVIALAFAKNGSTIEWCSGQILPINRVRFLLPHKSTTGPFNTLSAPCLGCMSQGSFRVHASG